MNEANPVCPPELRLTVWTSQREASQADPGMRGIGCSSIALLCVYIYLVLTAITHIRIAAAPPYAKVVDLLSMNVPGCCAMGKV